MRCVFRTQSSIEDEAFCENSEQHKIVTCFYTKSSVLHVCQYSKYNYYNFKKAATDNLHYSSVTIIVEYVNDTSEKNKQICF